MNQEIRAILKMLPFIVLSGACASTNGSQTSTDPRAERGVASDGMIQFECFLAKQPASGVRVTALKKDFRDTTKLDVSATVEILSHGQVRKKVTNALIGERFGPEASQDGTQVWGMSLTMGRSGNVNMGYDLVSGGAWYLYSNLLEFNTQNKEAQATCRTQDASSAWR